jgi:hypothetical protein
MELILWIRRDQGASTPTHPSPSPTPNNGTGPELVFYLTGNGNPLLVLDADVEAFLSGGGVGAGITYPAAAGASFAGPYGLSLTQSLGGSKRIARARSLLTVLPTPCLALSI